MQIVTLPRLESTRGYQIKCPIWCYKGYGNEKGTRCVGLDVEVLQHHNDIEILYTRKDGTRLWDGHYYFDGNLRKFFKTMLKSGRYLLIVPFYSLQRLERENASNNN